MQPTGQFGVQISTDSLPSPARSVVTRSTKPASACATVLGKPSVVLGNTFAWVPAGSGSAAQPLRQTSAPPSESDDVLRSPPPGNEGSPTAVAPSAGRVSQVTLVSLHESSGRKRAQCAGSPSCAQPAR